MAAKELEPWACEKVMVAYCWLYSLSYLQVCGLPRERI